MGHVIAYGICFGCHKTFAFNPVKVPSMRDVAGEKQPICRACMAVVNARRPEFGLEPFEIAEDAYEACDESLI